MTLQKAKSIARDLGLTLRQLSSGNYRVNFRDGNESTAYYTDKFEDAVNAVGAMARKQALWAAADPVALATGWLPPMPHSSGSDRQMFGADEVAYRPCTH